MISRIFIDRPIFAWVIAIMVMMAGLGAIMGLPIAQYPDVAPPQVSIRATYPGASAETVQNSVTQIVEQSLTGIDGLLYFSSSSSSRGTVSITATFRKSTDPDIAQVQVQNQAAADGQCRCCRRSSSSRGMVGQQDHQFQLPARSSASIPTTDSQDRTATWPTGVMTKIASQISLVRVPGVGDGGRASASHLCHAHLARSRRSWRAYAAHAGRCGRSGAQSQNTRSSRWASSAACPQVAQPGSQRHRHGARSRLQTPEQFAQHHRASRPRIERRQRAASARRRPRGTRRRHLRCAQWSYNRPSRPRASRVLARTRVPTR